MTSKCSYAEEYYEVNDLIPNEDRSVYKIVRKKVPRLMGWMCNCGFITMKREELEKHWSRIIE